MTENPTLIALPASTAICYRIHDRAGKVRAKVVAAPSSTTELAPTETVADPQRVT